MLAWSRGVGSLLLLAASVPAWLGSFGAASAQQWSIATYDVDDLLPIAGERGLSLYDLVARASRKDPAALRTVLSFAGHRDSTRLDASLSWPALLWGLLRRFGDGDFAYEVAQSPDHWRPVILRALDRAAAVSYSQHFPNTWALGSHDSVLTPEPGETPEEVAGRRRVYLPRQVHRQAAPAPGSCSSPSFPSSLHRRGASGRVVFEFVVTSGGRIDPNNFRLVSTSHRELVRPAEQVIWACDFAPAYIGDRRVRVRMRQAIDFAPDYLVVGGEGGRAVVELGRVQALAEAAGVDYGFTVGRAWRGDTAAISILLDLPSLVDIQNPLFEGYAELMLGLLQRFGDQLFAGLLSSLAPPVQLQAARALEGIRGRGFPLTDSLLLAALPATTDRARPPPGDNTGPFEEDVLTTRPDIIRGTCRLPHYPESMRQAGIEGRVLLELVIDTLGRVEPGSVRVISSNHAPFEAPAIFTARSCSFRPGRIDGRAVRVRVQVPINFSISRD